MRLRRMAAGSRGWLGAEGGRAKALEALVCRCSQACLAVSMRVRWASVAGEARLSADGTRIAQVTYFAGLRAGGGGLFHVACGLRPSASAKRRAQIGMFTQRVRGGLRGGFLLGAARRGVAF